MYKQRHVTQHPPVRLTINDQVETYTYLEPQLTRNGTRKGIRNTITDRK